MVNFGAGEFEAAFGAGENELAAFGAGELERAFGAGENEAGISA